MNALTTIDQDPVQTPGPHGKGHTILTPSRQADFLQSLQEFGNVRLACKVACISAQTAYRARRAAPGFARAWDAALLAARAHAEATLGDRALSGVEEAVYYHGEEVARRRRYDSRLLLAHLARLDRLEERADITAELAQLDARIDGLRAGEAIPDEAPPARVPAQAEASASAAQPGDRNSPQDRVPCVPTCRACAAGQAGDPGADHEPMLHCVEDDGRSYYAENTDVADAIAHTGSWVRKVPPPGYADWRPDMDDPDHWVDGRYVPPLSRALDAMEDARPADAPPMEHLGEIGAVEAAQLDAFLDGEDEWWLMDGEGKCVDWPADDAEAGGVEPGDVEAGDGHGESAVLAGRTG